MRRITVALLFLLLLAAVGVGFIYGRDVPFEEQWPLFEALRTTSAIIFAVVGAWLAIVYPERLRLTLSPTVDTQAKQSPNNIGILLSPIVNSTVVLCIVLLLGVLAPLLKRAHFVEMYLAESRGISYALLVALTLWQAWTVILTLIPADLLLSRSNQEHRRRDVLDGMRRTSISRKTSEK